MLCKREKRRILGRHAEVQSMQLQTSKRRIFSSSYKQRIYSPKGYQLKLNGSRALFSHPNRLLAVLTSPVPCVISQILSQCLETAYL